MLVRATKAGYYDHRRRREGDTFFLKEKKIKRGGVEKTVSAESQFSERWMVKVDEKPKASKKSKVEEVQEENPASIADQDVI